jgi:succinoglycan biosynthesis transport protein ExoP
MDVNPQAPEPKLHFLDYWRVVKSRKAIVFTVALLVVLTAATFTYFQPRIFVSSVRIKVEPDKPNVAVFERESVPSYDPYFLQTQYEIIQSKNILYPVIEQMGLHTVEYFGKAAGRPLRLDEAFSVLRQKLSVRQYRNTTLIEISVYDERPQLAADIANKIAKVFEEQRLQVKRELTLRGLEALRDQLKEQEARVAKAQEELERIRKELGVTMFKGNVKPNELAIQQMEARLSEARVDALTRKVRLEKVRQLSLDELRNAISTIMPDANIQTLMLNLADAQQRLAMTREDFGPEHPNVKALESAIQQITEQLNARLEGIQTGFEVDYLVAQARVEQLEAELNELKSAGISLEGEKYLPFENAQRALESEIRIFEVLKDRISQETIAFQVPRSPVEVIDRAESQRFPVKPNVRMNLALSVVVGLLGGVLLAFFIEYLDTSVKIMEDVERYLGLPVLGVISQNAKAMNRPDVNPVHVEAYRMLRTNIEFTKHDPSINAFAMVSAGAGEGKSLTTFNLGCIYAQQGATVLIVDSDMRRPTLHKYAGSDKEVGLTDFLTGDMALDIAAYATDVPNLYFIPCGSRQLVSQAVSMLTSERMQNLIHEARKRFDIVLFDTPPILGVSDSAVIIKEVGNAIMVVQHRRYPRNMVQRARMMVEKAGGKILGVIVNNVNVTQDDTYHYYFHSRYDHYAPSVVEEPVPKPDKPEKIQLTETY